MRHVTFAVIISVFLVTPAPNGWGQQRSRTEVTFSPTLSHRLTITQGDMTLSSVVVPVGMFISVTHDDAPTVPALGSLAFHGDVIVRVQPYATAPTPLAGSADGVMSNAPFVLALAGTDVLIENIAP
jgi:hypothetical protein